MKMETTLPAVCATPPAMKPPPDFAKRLTDEELDQLDQFFLNKIDKNKTWLLDYVDGMMHAIAIGPQTIMPSQWLPRVGGARKYAVTFCNTERNRVNHHAFDSSNE
jgi:yecA family protein